MLIYAHVFCTISSKSNFFQNMFFLMMLNLAYNQNLKLWEEKCFSKSYNFGNFQKNVAKTNSIWPYVLFSWFLCLFAGILMLMESFFLTATNPFSAPCGPPWWRWLLSDMVNLKNAQIMETNIKNRLKASEFYCFLVVDHHFLYFYKKYFFHQHAKIVFCKVAKNDQESDEIHHY